MVSPQLERYIQMNLRSELAQVQQHMVQNQTATMLELGTSLLNQTTTQTRKLTDLEAQVPESDHTKWRDCGWLGSLIAQVFFP